jgi:putative ATP-dependent endonuclease of the OLD family
VHKKETKNIGKQMKLNFIRLCNFQSFGEEPTEITFEKISYLIGPNGAGKTAALQALCRLFAFDPTKRRIIRSDFHVPFDESDLPEERHLWIEADFQFPELTEDENHTTIPPHFGHMRLDDSEGVPRVRFRLEATIGVDGDIEENLVYVLEVDSEGNPSNTARVPKGERNNIHVHYLPARRDPADHITYSTSALLGRVLRAVQWSGERETIKDLTDQISNSMATNTSIKALSSALDSSWKSLHKGSFFNKPTITFVNTEIEALLRHMSVSFSPGHDERLIDFSRLSDGQKSMLYLSLVLSTQAIGRAALSGEDSSFDPVKLKPPVFTLVAVEEPENSLSPHYLGRIVTALNTMTVQNDAQAVIATHAPSMLRRVDPKHIRYLRLNERRISKVKSIQLPPDTNEAQKYVREAVQAFPEIYFSRLVVLGEGDSEEIVLPRILQAKGIPFDESAVTIAPLGGRHVNHFWRLLSDLKIPYITLLDLDIARYQGGWGRIKYANDQLKKFNTANKLTDNFENGIQNWNDSRYKIRNHLNYLEELENRNIFYSYPLDLDFSMILAFPGKYGIEENTPTISIIQSVLGKNHFDSTQYSDNELKLFESYHQKFKLGSKPATHIEALASITESELLSNMPEVYKRLANAVISKLEELPE